MVNVAGSVGLAAASRDPKLQVICSEVVRQRVDHDDRPLHFRSNLYQKRAVP